MFTLKKMVPWILIFPIFLEGLDPAGPWFEDKPLSVGLNKDCADFVDAWHTHGKPSLIVNCGTLKVNVTASWLSVFVKGRAEPGVN